MEKTKKKPMNTTLIVIIVVAVIVLLSLGLNFLFGKKSSNAEMVTVGQVTKGNVTSTLETSGTITSELTRTYSSPVAAEIDQLNVVAGQSVKKGEYLLTYDTASLEKSYSVAELQAKAEQSTVSDSLEKEQQNQTDLSQASTDASTYQGQVDALKAEIATLEAQQTQYTIQGNNNSGLQAEITDLETQLATLQAKVDELQAKYDAGTNTAAELEELKATKDKRDTVKEKIEKRQNKMVDATDLANAVANLTATLSDKQSQLTDLESKLAEAESTKTTAESSLMTDSQKANLDATTEKSKLTLEEEADKLSEAKAGVVADFDGIVTSLKASSGTALLEGGEILTLASANDICIDIPVSKYNLENLAMDQKATITFQDHTYTGSVSYISRVAEAKESGSAMVNIKVHLDNPDDKLVLGLEAKVSIALGESSDVLKVPTTAVNTDSQGDFVYVVKGADQPAAEKTVEKKYVTTGLNSSDEIEIKDGLAEGDTIISAVSSDYADGTVVEINTDTEAVTTTEALTGSTGNDTEAVAVAKAEDDGLGK